MRGVLSPLKAATELLAEPAGFEPPGVVYDGIRWLERLTDFLAACALLQQSNFALQPRPLTAGDWVQTVIWLVSPLSAGASRSSSAVRSCPRRWLGMPGGSGTSC